MSAPDLSALGSWGRSLWNIRGGVKFARLGGPFILIEFENKEETDKVLLRGYRWFKESFLHLDRWNPKVGCSQNGEWVKDVRVRVVALPLHFWSREVFRKIGDCCGGFVAVDEDTAAFKELQWARLLVKSEGLEWPSSLQVVVGSSCYAIQLWWEVQPEVSKVAPMIRNETGKEQEVRDDGGGDSRADFNVEKVQTHGQPAKVAMSCEIGEGGCRKDRKVELSDLVSTRGAEVDVARGSQQTVWEETTNFGPVTQVSLGRVREMVMERRPTEEGQVSGVLKEFLEVGWPMTMPLKGPVVVKRPNIEVLNGVGVRGGLRDCGEQGGKFLVLKWGCLHRP